MHRSSRPWALALVLSLLAWCAAASARQCEPRWINDFPANDFNGSINAVADFNDGGGPAMFAAGSFASGPDGLLSGYVARWDGATWTDASAGLNGNVRTLCVHDAGDGAGPSLYAGGDFWIARPGLSHSLGIGRWDGARWVGVGAGPGQGVRALISFDDASGRKLFAAGEFVSLPGRNFRGAGMWNGSTWDVMGAGLQRNNAATGVGMTWAVFDDGAGERLYLGGLFDTADGVPCSGLARWTGATFEPVGGGVRFLAGTGAFVRVLTVSATGTPTLLVGGAFNEAGGVPASNVAQWDGAALTPLGDGLLPAGSSSSYVLTLRHFEGAVYAGGIFTGTGSGLPAINLARLNGAAWEPVAPGSRGTVVALHPCGLCPDPLLFVAGQGVWSTWDGVTLRTSANGLNGAAYNGLVADLGDGPALYVVGNFTIAGSTEARRIARWDGDAWSTLGGGFGCSADRWPIERYDDGTGNTLYVAACGGVWRWNGATWSLLPAEPFMTVFIDMKVFDRGDGPRLYVLGGFTQSSSLFYRLSSWDGQQWTHIASSNAHSWPFGRLAVIQDRQLEGAQAGVYVNASFSSFGGISTNGLVRYDGYSFSRVGQGDGIETSSGGNVSTMAVAGPIGSRPRSLYLGGSIYRAGGVPIQLGIAGWDGSDWFQPAGGAPLASGQTSALAAVNDGRGEALYVSGAFVAEAGQPPVSTLARFGSSGFELINDDPSLNVAVRAIVPMYVNKRLSLFLLGSIHRIGGQNVGNIARLELCPPSPPCPADWNHDGTLNTDDFFSFIEALVGENADFNADGFTNSQDFFDFLSAFYVGC